MGWKRTALTLVLMLAAFSVLGSLASGHILSASVGILIILAVAAVQFRQGYRDGGGEPDIDA